MALGIAGLGSLFKETGITTTLLGRNHSSNLNTSAAKNDISSILKMTFGGKETG